MTPPHTLKPCPFCGCKPKVHQQHSPSGIAKQAFVGVDTLIQCEARRCPCGPSTGSYTRRAAGDYPTDDDYKRAVVHVAKQWNRRAL